MDLEDIQSDLHALRKLYGLLLHDGDYFQNHKSEILDEKSRNLLKDLLDGAAEKVLKITSEVMSTNLGVSNTRSFTQQQKSQELPKLPFLLTNASNTCPNGVQRTEKDLSSQATDLSKDQRISIKQTAQPVASEQSQVSISLIEPQNRKKRCRVCQRRTAKQLKSTEERKFSAEEIRNIDKAIISLQPQLYNLSGQYKVDEQEKEQDSNSKAIIGARSNERQSQRRICEFQSNPSGNEFPVCLSNNVVCGIVKSGALQNFTEGIGKKPEDTDFISKEASDVIKIIESRISALGVGGEHVGSLEKQSAAQHGLFEFSASSVSGAGLVSPIMLKKKGVVTKGDHSHVGQFVMGRNDSNGRLINRRAWEPKDSTRLHKVPRQMVSPLIEIELPNQSVRNSTPLPPCNDVLSKLMTQNVRKDDGISSRHDKFSQGGESIEGHILGTQKDSLVPVQNVKAIVEKIESASQNNHMPSQIHNSVQGLRIPLNLDKNTSKNILPAKLPSETNKENVDGNLPLKSVARSTDVTRLGRKKQAFDAGNKLIWTQTRATTQRGKGPSHRTTMRQTLPDKKCDQMDEERGGVKKKISHEADQQESGDTSSVLRSSSSWTTHQGSTSYYDSEEYSLTGQSRSQQRLGSTTSSESEVYYHPGRTRGHHSAHTSDSDSEMYSVSSRTRSQVDYSSRSENRGYLPSDQTSSSHSIRIPSRRLGPTSNYRSANRKRSEKHTGRLRKLKDKLAIIFHHHHHHHHHHRYSDDDARSDQHSQLNQGTSLWKHAGRLFHRRSSAEVHGEQPAEKLRKSVIRNVGDKKQGGNFHTVVDGFARHVRHSKKSTNPKLSSIGRQAKGQHVSKKVVKKVHWWQMLRRHGGIKMPKRPRFKLRFGSKKPQLQPLPTIKWG